MRNPYREASPEKFAELEAMAKSGATMWDFKHRLDLVAWVDEQLAGKLDVEKRKLSTKLYWIFHGLEALPVCPGCGKREGYLQKDVDLESGYRKTCSRKCSAACSKEKIRASHWANAPDKKAAVLEKMKQTSLARHGQEHYTNREKAKKTCLERWGCENPSAAQAVKDKKRKRSLAKYGVSNPNKLPEVQAKIQKTCVERYGVVCQFQRRELREKMAAGTKLRAWKTMLASEMDQPAFSFEQLCQREDDRQKLLFRCLACGKTFEASHHDGWHKPCPDCYRREPPKTSAGELELLAFVQQQLPGCQVLHGCRDALPAGQELDVYVPNWKIAFEFDGLYWHSEEAGRGKSYHLAKTEACEKAGIRLVHIFEYEWRDRREAAESYIQQLLGTSPDQIQARDCQAVELDFGTARKFFTETSFPEAIPGSCSLGLLHSGKLVHAMSFERKTRGKWKIAASSSQLHVCVAGAEDCLIEAFYSRAGYHGKLSFEAPRRVALPAWLAGWKLVQTAPPALLSAGKLPWHVWDCGKLAFTLSGCDFASLNQSVPPGQQEVTLTEFKTAIGEAMLSNKSGRGSEKITLFKV